MQSLAELSPLKHALDATRGALLDHRSLAELWVPVRALSRACSGYDSVMQYGLVLTAAGASSRFGFGKSKVLELLGGVPVLVRAARPFLEVLSDLDVVVTCRDADRPGVTSALSKEPRLRWHRV